MCKNPRPRRVRLPSLVDFFCGKIPINESILFLYFFAVCRSVRVLWKRSDASCFEFTECLYQCWSRYLCKFFKERSRCLSFIYANSTDLEYISLIHAFTHFHDGNSCFFFSIEQSCLYRRCATISRQDRSMHIDTHFFWHLE